MRSPWVQNRRSAYHREHTVSQLPRGVHSVGPNLAVLIGLTAAACVLGIGIAGRIAAAVEYDPSDHAVAETDGAATHQVNPSPRPTRPIDGQIAILFVEEAPEKLVQRLPRRPASNAINYSMIRDRSFREVVSDLTDSGAASLGQIVWSDDDLSPRRFVGSAEGVRIFRNIERDANNLTICTEFVFVPRTLPASDSRARLEFSLYSYADAASCLAVANSEVEMVEGELLAISLSENLATGFHPQRRPADDLKTAGGPTSGHVLILLGWESRLANRRGHGAPIDER